MYDLTQCGLGNNRYCTKDLVSLQGMSINRPEESAAVSSGREYTIQAEYIDHPPRSLSGLHQM